MTCNAPQRPTAARFCSLFPNHPSLPARPRARPARIHSPGLLTRAALQHFFDDLRGSQGRDGQVFCLFVDLDRFKQVNDTLGHDAGDLLLKKVSKRLLKCTRDDDHVLRLGGDEFLVLGSTLDPQRTIEDLGERIVEYVSRPYLLSGNQAVIGASVGAAVHVQGSDLETLLRRADLALYHSKRTGRGRASLYHDQMEDQADLRRQLDITLRRALVTGAFEVHFQPQFDMKDQKLVGFEALLRLREEDGSPRDARPFLHLAEETRLIVKVGQVVLVEAIRAAKQWPEHVNVAINVSEVELRHGQLADTIEGLLATHGVAADRISLEVRETVLATACAATMQNLRDIEALGVNLVLDKLGTRTHQSPACSPTASPR